MKKQKPKILIVTTVPETLKIILAGQPKWLNQTFDVLLASSPLEELAEVASTEGTVVHALPMYRGIAPGADVVSIWRMYRLLRKLKPELVHSYTPKAGLVTMIAAWIARVPVRIHTFTGLIFPIASGARHQVLKNVDRLIALAATRIVPEGEGVKKDLVAFKVTKKTLRVIGNGNIVGVDTAYFDPDDADVVQAASNLRSSLGLEDTDFVFGYMGRFNRDKGLDELVDAFSRFSEEKCWLLLFGRYDETNPPSEETWRRIQDDPRILIGGFLDDVRSGMLAIDTIVLPSYREGFPNVLLQGAAMRRPLIATDISGSNEIIIDGKTGFLVPPRDAIGLSEAMARMMFLSIADRNAVGVAGRVRVQKLFEQSRYREALLAFYLDALSEGSRT